MDRWNLILKLESAFSNLKRDLWQLESIPNDFQIDKKTQRKLILKKFHESWMKHYQEAINEP